MIRVKRSIYKEIQGHRKLSKRTTRCPYNSAFQSGRRFRGSTESELLVGNCLTSDSCVLVLRKNTLTETSYYTIMNQN